MTIHRGAASYPDGAGQRAAVALRNIRPIERISPPRPGTVECAQVRGGAVERVQVEATSTARTIREVALAGTRPGYTKALVDGRPVVIYIERDRLRWGKLAALVAAIGGPIVGVIGIGAYAVGFMVAWIGEHWSLIFGSVATLAVVAFALATLSRVGICCPGLHCPGCGHR